MRFDYYCPTELSFVYFGKIIIFFLFSSFYFFGVVNMLEEVDE